MKPVINVPTLTNSKTMVFVSHITCIETAPRGCLVHLSSGKIVETSLSLKEIETIIELNSVAVS